MKNEIIPKDEDIAELIKKKATPPIVIDTDSNFYKAFIETISIPKENDEYKIKAFDFNSEYFTYRAKLYSEIEGHKTHIVCWFTGEALSFGLLYRDLLIADGYNIDFYRDLGLDLYMITINSNLNCPWHYVKNGLSS